MNSLFNKLHLPETVRRFHNDEQGMAPVESIMTLGVCAVIMYGIYELWTEKGKTGVGSLITTICEWGVETLGY